MQYSDAQSLIQLKEPGKIEIPNLNNPPPTKDEKEPTAKGGEPQIEGEEPKPQKQYTSGLEVNEDKTEIKSKEELNEQSTFTCIGDSVDKPTKAECTITGGGISSSYQCNADAITQIWSCVEETGKTSTDKSTFSSILSVARHEVLKAIVQNLRG